MTQHPFVNEIAGQPPIIPPRSWARRVRLPWIVAAVGIAVGALLLLAYLPVAQSSSFQISLCTGESGSLDVPLGSVLSVSWSPVSGSNTGILVSQQNLPLFQSAESSGNAFVAVPGYGEIDFTGSSAGAPCIEGHSLVHVSWRAAVLWWLVQPN
ncbi:MAG: hypothetical protein L3K02_06775 [Thermoplasmata archaeon]|nr:hypothetical protein [Thermoplasmata archaeon]